eukprot:tig00000310_g23982.t1
MHRAAVFVALLAFVLAMLALASAQDITPEITPEITPTVSPSPSPGMVRLPAPVHVPHAREPRRRRPAPPRISRREGFFSEEELITL